ncbi:MAG: hypothetical protein K2H39_05145, partial [Paramuribaculum sp.]|nr:hypothetical protein [Paramuribaculum sp.]
MPPKIPNLPKYPMFPNLQMAFHLPPGRRASPMRLLPVARLSRRDIHFVNRVHSCARIAPHINHNPG